MAAKRICGVMVALIVLMTSLTPLLAQEQGSSRTWDSWGSLTTAADIRRAVSDLNSSSSKEDVEYVASAVRSLSRREQERLTNSTIRTLGDYYNRYYSEDVKIYTSGFTSGRKMNESYSYGAAVAAGGDVRITLDQRDPSSSRTVLQFYMTANQSLDGPVILDIGLPDNFNNSYDYYVRGPDGRLSVDIHRDGDIRYARFTTLSTGTFQLVRSSEKEDDVYDDGSPMLSSLWRSVISAIRQAGSGERVQVDMGTRTSVPADVLRELRRSNTTLCLRYSDGEQLVISSAQVGVIPASRDSYSISVLEKMYGSSEASSSQTQSSSCAASSSPPISYCPPLSSQSPPASSYYQVSYPVVSSSSVASQMEESSSLEEGVSILPEEPEVEIEAEEESRQQEEQESPSDGSGEPFKTDSASTSPQEKRRFAFFAGLTIFLAVVISGVLTLVVYLAKRQ